jgi:PKD repeat protein
MIGSSIGVFNPRGTTSGPESLSIASRLGYWNEDSMVKAGGLTTRWNEVGGNTALDFVAVSGSEPLDAGDDGLENTGDKRMRFASPYTFNGRKFTIYFQVKMNGPTELLGSGSAFNWLFYAQNGISQVNMGGNALDYQENTNAEIIVPSDGFIVGTLVCYGNFNPCILYINGVEIPEFNPNNMNLTSFDIQELFGVTSHLTYCNLKKLALYSGIHSYEQVYSNTIALSGYAAPQLVDDPYKLVTLTTDAAFPEMDGVNVLSYTNSVTGVQEIHVIQGWNNVWGSPFDPSSSLHYKSVDGGRTFIQLPDAPFSHRHTACRWVANGKIYIGHGDTLYGGGVAPRDVWSYDSINGWLLVVADTGLTPNGRILAGSCVHKDWLYMACGQSDFTDAATHYNDVIRTQDFITWQVMGTIPISYASYPIFVSDGTNLYISGGFKYHSTRVLNLNTYKSTDDGANWLSMGAAIAGMEPVFCNGAIFDNKLWWMNGARNTLLPNSDSGNRRGLFYTPLDSLDWKAMNKTQPARHASGMTTQDGALYFGVGNFYNDFYKVIPFVNTILDAEFKASQTSVNEGGSVTFTDKSNNNPTIWNWSFPGGTPSTSTSQNPSITYSTPGTYNATLIAQNALGAIGTETKTSYITVEEFNPSHILGLQAWHEDDVLGTYTTKDGSNLVSQFRDRSVNLRHQNITGTNRPLWSAAGPNGRPTLIFDGSNDYLEALGFLIPQPFTIFIKGKALGNGQSLICSANSGTIVELYRNGAGVFKIYGGAEIGSHNSSSYITFSIIGNGASSSIYIDNSLNAPGNIGGNSFDGLRLGKNASLGEQLNGEIQSVVAYSGVLSGADLTRVYNYLNRV